MERGGQQWCVMEDCYNIHYLRYCRYIDVIWYAGANERILRCEVLPAGRPSTTTGVISLHHCVSLFLRSCIIVKHYDFGIIFTLFNSNYAITIITAILRFLLYIAECAQFWYFETKRLHNHSHPRLCVKLKMHRNKSWLGLCHRPH